jgi:serine/threonine protein kinase
MRQSYLEEREILIKIADFKHERILGLPASFEVRSTKTPSFNLIFPFASGGDLGSFLRLEEEPDWEISEFPKSFVDGKLRDWRLSLYDEVIGIAEVLKFLHDEKNGFIVLHRDIKPSNILIEGGRLKLADFGLSRFKGNDETSKTDWMLRTLMYAPPPQKRRLAIPLAEREICGHWVVFSLKLP